MKRAIYSDREAATARLRGQILPTVSVLIGSALTLLPIIATSPVLPPFGFLMLLGWRLLRPELWPVWIGVPLGFADDLFSGQPIGSAVLLWTLVMLALEALDRRVLFRDLWQDWLTAALAIILVLSGGVWTANLAGGQGELKLIVPQVLISMMAFPFVARLCAALDRWRLA